MVLVKLPYTNQYTIMIIGMKIKEYISEGISFNQETTLSGKSIIRNIKMAKDNGFHVVINYIGVDSPEIAKE